MTTRNRFIVAFFSTVFAVLVLGVPARAQYWPSSAATTSTKYVDVDTGIGWVLAPVGTGSRVSGWFAYYTGTSAVGDNLTFLYYKRSASDTWTTWGWRDATLCEALHYVEESVNQGPQFTCDAYLNAAMACEPPSPAKSPTEIQNGVFVDDEAAQQLVAAATDKDGVITDLQQAGWSVAVLMSNLAVITQNCQGSAETLSVDYLTSITVSAETQMFGSSTITVSTCGQMCQCTRSYSGWTPTTNPTTGLPFPWTFVSQRRTMGGWVCTYRRPGTRTVTQVGEWPPILCFDCGNTWPETGYETATTFTADPGTTCSPPPP